jgi:phosphoribosylanthranilate isomerase
MAVKVKICGLTKVSDTRAAIAAGADLLGFIFARESPRFVTPLQVRRILAATQPNQAGVRTVGVFVNETLAAVARLLAFCGLDLAQLHGDEPPTFLGCMPGSSTLLRGRAYKGLRPRSIDEAIELARSYAVPGDARTGDLMPAALLDSFCSDRRGGTGAVADWSIGARLAAEYPLLVAGGLSPSNVAEAVSVVRPWGVDVSSGVEARPGHKDHAAVLAFIEAAKTAIR